MSGALFSQSWHRVSYLKLRLRKHVDVYRHLYRGKVWYLLQDHATGQYHRFTPSAYQIIGLLDGRRTLQEVWESACSRLGDEMPSQDEIVDIIGRLFWANVVQSNATPDIEKLHNRRTAQARKKFLQQMKSPLGIRIPLWDPENFLNRTQFLIRPLFSLWGGIFWLAITVYAVVLAMMNWEPLTLNVSDRVLAGENLFLLALIYPVVKTVHEFGHAYAVKRWGGEVHEIGIMLLVFFPVPYVDASAAIAFRSHWQRMLVGAIGIIVEVFIASLAMIFWASAEPGLARSLAYNTMLIAGISTLLFNGNPLLRFDAYYVLADYLQMPNFGQKANQYIGYLVKKYLAGVRELHSPSQTIKEKMWLTGYGITAFIYRFIVMMTIGLFVASEYFIIGIMLALWLVYMSVISPLFRVISIAMKDYQLRSQRKRMVKAGGGLAVTLGALLFLLPVPYSTVVEGVIRPVEESAVRAREDGFIKQIRVQNGDIAGIGDPLVDMINPDLAAKSRIIKARLQEAKAIWQAELDDRVKTTLNNELIHLSESELRSVNSRLNTLNISSPAYGEVVIPGRDSLVGQYILRGQLVGYVVDYSHLPVVAMVHEDDIDRVRTGTNTIEIRPVSDRESQFKASLHRIVPASADELPSQVLSTAGGGRIALSPDADKKNKTLERYFLLELAPNEMPVRRLDERIYVKFVHQPEPVAWRWYRGIRRLFLRRFDV